MRTREGERARGREGERARGRDGERARGREGQRARRRDGETVRGGAAIRSTLTLDPVRTPTSDNNQHQTSHSPCECDVAFSSKKPCSVRAAASSTLDIFTAEACRHMKPWSSSTDTVPTSPWSTDGKMSL